MSGSCCCFTQNQWWEDSDEVLVGGLSTDDNTESQQQLEDTKKPNTAAPPAARAERPRPCALYALIVFTMLNLMNYCDRYIPSSTKEAMKAEWSLTDAETGLAALVFLLVYMVGSPLFGGLADSGISRKLLLLFGIIVWSVASSAAYFTTNLLTFLVTRAFVGLGESSFSIIAPTFLCDFYPPLYRNKALAVFYLSMPLGAGIGFGLGGVLSEAFGWKAAYLITGIPGLLIALLLLPLRDPGLGSFDKNPSETPALLDTLKFFARRKMYVFSVIGLTFNIFGVGAMADWLPAFFNRIYPDIPPDLSGLIIGGTTFFGGLFGIALGGVLPEFIRGKTKHHYMATMAIASYFSVVCICIAVYVEEFYVTSFFAFLAQLFIFITSAPGVTITGDIMPGNMRSRALGLSYLVTHSFGDAISPTILGAILDLTSNVRLALSVIPLAITLSAMVYLSAWRCLDPKESLPLDQGENEVLVTSKNG